MGDWSQLNLVRQELDIMRDIIEGTIYTLIVLIIYAVPFFIPGITIKEGVVFIFCFSIFTSTAIMVVAIIKNILPNKGNRR